jgi:hypothetical protein
MNNLKLADAASTKKATITGLSIVTLLKNNIEIWRPKGNVVRALTGNYLFQQTKN